MGKYVTGLTKLRAVLAALPQAAKDELQQGMQESGEKLNDMQRSLAPVGKTSKLKQSIRTEPLTNGRIGVAVRAGGVTTTKPVKNGQSPSYDYAVGVELGTHDALAHPFFYPAYRAQKTAIRRRASSAVIKAVQKAAQTP